MDNGLHIKDDGRVTDAFAQAMLFLAAGKPASKLETAGIRAYALALGDIPVADVQAACLRALRELPSQWLPSPAELRQFVTPLAADAGLLAWAGLCAAAVVHGAWTDIEVGDRAAAGALLAVFGTWAAFCAAEDGPALTMRRTEFLAAYRQQAALGGPTEPVRVPGLLAATGHGGKVPVAQVLLPSAPAQAALPPGSRT